MNPDTDPTAKLRALAQSHGHYGDDLGRKLLQIAHDVEFIFEGLADEVVWHINGGRTQSARNIIERIERCGLVLPISRLTCGDLSLIMEHRKRMGADG